VGFDQTGVKGLAVLKRKAKNSPHRNSQGKESRGEKKSELWNFIWKKRGRWRKKGKRAGEKTLTVGVLHRETAPSWVSNGGALWNRGGKFTETRRKRERGGRILSSMGGL